MEKRTKILVSAPIRGEKLFNLKAGQDTSRAIWAIGGGKGGTGKTFIASSLGLELSQGNLEVVMIDADLGAPNLHTFLGLPSPEVTLADFVYKKVRNLEEVMTETPHGRLKLVSGSSQRLYMANLGYQQKQKLLRHIQGLNHSHTIIDTGGGTYFNCIDFFSISDHGILVANPDPASIENAYQFLRSVTLRILKAGVRRYGMGELVERAAESRKNAPESIDGLLQLVRSDDQNCGELLRESLDRFRPCLIMNKVDGEDDAVLGESISQVIKRYLAIDLTYLGAVPYDDKVDLSVKKFTPFVYAHPHSKTTYAIKKITDRLLKTVYV